MFTFIFVVLLTLLIAGGVFLFVQYNIQLNIATGKTSPNNKLTRDKNPAYEPETTTTRWKAVRVKAGLMCCKSAERMRGQVYLTAAAPAFPLEGCKSKSCECKYIHMNDRREDDDRRESTEFITDLYNLHGKDRRKIKDRRKSIV
jgi:hypothetical protein